MFSRFLNNVHIEAQFRRVCVWLGCEVHDFIEIVGLALPIIGQSLFRTLLFIVDRAFLGHLSADALASMQISGSFIFASLMIISSFTVGTLALIGRAMGAKNLPLVQSTVRATFYFALLFGICFTALIFPNIDTIISLFPDAPISVHEASRSYLSIALPSFPLYLLVMAQTSILQASYDTRSPFRISVFTTVLNIILDYLLIFGCKGIPSLGVQGAAIASVTACCIQCILLFVVILRKEQFIDAFRSRGQELYAIRRILQVASGAFAERFVQYGSYFAYMALIASLGEVAMAAHQALISIGSLCFLPADAFGIAAAAMCANKLGAKNPRGAKTSSLLSCLFATLFLSAIAVLFMLFPEFFIRIFSHDSAIIALGARCLIISALLQPLTAIAVVLADAFRGAGSTRISCAITIIGGVFVRFFASWYFAIVLALGLPGIWWGIFADWFVRTLLAVPIYVRGRWLKKEI